VPAPPRPRRRPQRLQRPLGHPLEQACRFHKGDCIPLLVAGGADPTIPEPLDRNARDWAVAYPPYLDAITGTTTGAATPRDSLGFGTIAVGLLRRRGIYVYLGPVARMLLDAGDAEACCVLLEESLGAEGCAKECGVCGAKIGRRPRLVCRRCADVDLCAECVDKYREDWGRDGTSSLPLGRIVKYRGWPWQGQGGKTWQNLFRWRLSYPYHCTASVKFRLAGCSPINPTPSCCSPNPSIAYRLRDADKIKGSTPHLQPPRPQAKAAGIPPITFETVRDAASENQLENQRPNLPRGARP